ncbi:hypothetical protein AYO44_00135 [Planctomycetaceae bacterium SCGC AG-212-F19]|nr:hypothetical protein AYO44_00135 [Planctomycetaceae bacterium SCGC AG-212-F19]
MFTLRSFLAIGIMLGLAGLVDAADAAKKAKKKAAILQATVKAVDADKDKPETGTLTVQTVTKAKKGQPAPAGEEKKITVTSATKIEKLEGKAKAKKGQPAPTGTPAKLSDISSTSSLLITFKAGESNVAEKVQIVAAKKKAKKKANS